MFLERFILAAIAVVFAAIGFIRGAQASYPSATVEHLKTEIKHRLMEKLITFGAPRIELGVIRLVSGALPATIQGVTFQGDNTLGEAQFSVYGNQQSAVIAAQYSAFTDVRVASRRIAPGEKINPEFFHTQEVNLATGMPYEMRGVLLPVSEKISQLETRQTILEGQFLVSTAVQKVPDVRRGDSVRIQVISGDLHLSTAGTATESGYSQSPLKVVTTKTRRELTGTLQPGGIVEVKL